MDTVRKHAHLVRPGEVVNLAQDLLWCVLEAADSWDGGTMLTVLDLQEGVVSNHFFAAFDEVDVLA